MNESGVVPAHSFKVLKVAPGAAPREGFAYFRSGVQVTIDRRLNKYAGGGCHVFHQGCLRGLPKLVDQAHGISGPAVEEHCGYERSYCNVTSRRQLRRSMSEFDTPAIIARCVRSPGSNYVPSR